MTQLFCVLLSDSLSEGDWAAGEGEPRLEEEHAAARPEEYKEQAKDEGHFLQTAHHSNIAHFVGVSYVLFVSGCLCDWPERILISGGWFYLFVYRKR